jgi:hypothetical protein
MHMVVASNANMASIGGAMGLIVCLHRNGTRVHTPIIYKDEVVDQLGLIHSSHYREARAQATTTISYSSCTY